MSSFAQAPDINQQFHCLGKTYCARPPGVSTRLQRLAAFEAVFYSDPLILVLARCSGEQALQVARVNKGIRYALRRLRPGLALRSVTLALKVAGGGLFRVEELGLTSLADVTPVSPLVDLTHLDLGGTRVANVTPLSTLVKLTNLSLFATKVTDLRPLGELDKLRIIRGLHHLLRDVLLSDQSRRRMLLHEGETVGELAARLGCDHLAVDGVQLDGDERVVDVEGELQM